MAHFKKRFDPRFAGSWDIPEGGVELTIESIKSEEVYDTQSKGKKTVNVVFFRGTKKGMILNVTNATAIASIHGNDDDDWIGKKVTLVAAKVRAFGGTHDAIRVKGKTSSTEDF